MISSHSATTTTHPEGRGLHRVSLVDKAQYGMAAFLVAAGGYVLYDASTLEKAFADQPVQPYALPNRPEAEEGEDVDLSHGTDLRTVGLLVAVLVANIVLIDLLGWAITGALLFAGAAGVLGSRSHVRDLAVGAALSVGTWYGFYVGLGIPIPAGVLDGVL
jgi:putative tricarboxylic transport membrane protein